MSDAWREWRASLESLGEGPFGDVGREWIEWIRCRLEALTGEDAAGASLFGQGAALVKSVLHSKSESDPSDGDALLRQLLRRIEALEARLDATATERDETGAP
jgi:hypothetical protein